MTGGGANQQPSADEAPKFVELGSLGASSFAAQVVVHVTGQDDKGLKMTIHGNASDVAVVIRKFWEDAP